MYMIHEIPLTSHLLLSSEDLAGVFCMLLFLPHRLGYPVTPSSSWGRVQALSRHLQMELRMWAAPKIQTHSRKPVPGSLSQNAVMSSEDIPAQLSQIWLFFFSSVNGFVVHFRNWLSSKKYLIWSGNSLLCLTCLFTCLYFLCQMLLGNRVLPLWSLGRLRRYLLSTHKQRWGSEGKTQRWAAQTRLWATQCLKTALWRYWKIVPSATWGNRTEIKLISMAFHHSRMHQDRLCTW